VTNAAHAVRRNLHRPIRTLFSKCFEATGDPRIHEGTRNGPPTPPKSMCENRTLTGPRLRGQD
jgi:hypothetical protein